ncbi:ComEC/Rec2 family competence protein [Clostridium kluyveri]|uniref:Hydrolase n=1 Tax=Clostridium kluyveri TaxID=1534 RepID=A0A1L5F5U7_CLOKL|nr:ComEC/Rec2 family competence protein [Clostridium kluyveri]APM38353.1 hydrolase [Clostridium kluyveri]UZQ50636.1 MBL fold metallo-hydrolase [Clostridium kluyveri]
MNYIKKYFNIIVLLISITFLISGCMDLESSQTSNSSNKSLEFTVHYIDIGQGDSELIQVNNKNLLIDAGPTKSTDKLLSYLNSIDIKKLDYVIATHPDEDHIGGMSTVINTYSIDKFYAPKKTVNTRAFENMITELKSKNMKIDVPKPGMQLDLGENTKAEILAPNSDRYEDTNNYSIVLKISYGNTKFLFTGDAEKLSEREILDKNYDISADVLKLGHHGSSTSTTDEFLDKVSPEIAIISCGADNKYGHPHKETLRKLKKRNIRIYRTDIDGNIVLISDGKNIAKK